MSQTSQESKPLPVTATLQDLAILRANGVELSSLLPREGKPKPGEGNAEHQEAIEQSNVFVGEMRKAIRIELSGDVDRIKGQIDKLGGEVEKARDNVERIQDEQLEMVDESE